MFTAPPLVSGTIHSQHPGPPNRSELPRNCRSCTGFRHARTSTDHCPSASGHLCALKRPPVP
eukprot:4421650-Prymnesium_polylepis.2